MGRNGGQGIRKRTVVATFILVASLGSLVSCSSGSSSTSTRAPQTLPQIARTTSTTKPSPTVFTGDLPQIGKESGPDEIRRLQELLNAVCCVTKVTGIWDAETEEALLSLRQILGLESGGLDTELWRKLFTVPSGKEFVARPSLLFAIPVPSKTFLREFDLQPPTEFYVIPADTDFPALKAWFDDEVAGAKFGDWYWCDAPASGFTTFEYRWWKRERKIAGALLTVKVSYSDFGRVDIELVEQVRPLQKCEGYVAPPTSPPTTIRPPQSSGSSGDSSSSSGGSSSCYVGMNLEDCEDLLGIGLGGRLVTLDCTGRGRGVFWARNWWIIDVLRGLPVISKSRSYCS